MSLKSKAVWLTVAARGTGDSCIKNLRQGNLREKRNIYAEIVANATALC